MIPSVRIAIDAMGGDEGLRITVPAALQSLRVYSRLSITLVGDEPLISEQLSAVGISSLDSYSERLSIVHAEEAITMDESPARALRTKKQSSIHVAINLLVDNQVDAVVSAGNTGALMAIAFSKLGMLEGIDRPAICSAIPHPLGYSLLLDLGANIESSADQLTQFAVMGSAMYQVLENKSQPTVALLNIGTEAIKGSPAIKSAAELLQQQELNYTGYIEGTDLFTGKADVIVCDGFVGNITLKSSESLALFISHNIKLAFTENWRGKLTAWLLKPLLRKLFYRLNPENYNGASLLGLNGVVVKSHGNSTVNAYVHAIEQAQSEVEHCLLEKITQQLRVQRNTIRG